MTDAKFLNRVFDVIEDEVVPKTWINVREKGCKLFGAAILRKDDLSTVLSETNTETENPMWHGEIHAIKKFYELPKDSRPAAKDCIFVATHEPCSLCLSGITWSGFDNFYYLFSHKDSEVEFGTPYDIQILKAVYAVPDPGQTKADPNRDLYNRTNEFFTSHNLKDLLKELDDPALNKRAEKLKTTYDEISECYQQNKGKLILP